MTLDVCFVFEWKGGVNFDDKRKVSIVKNANEQQWESPKRDLEIYDLGQN
jgi:hypothetical protein